MIIVMGNYLFDYVKNILFYSRYLHNHYLFFYFDIHLNKFFALLRAVCAYLYTPQFILCYSITYVSTYVQTVFTDSGIRLLRMF